MNHKTHTLIRKKFFYRLSCAHKKNLICAFSTRNHNYDFRASLNINQQKEVLNSRKLIFQALNLNLEKAVFFKQIHKSKIKKITNDDQGKGAKDFKSALPGFDAGFTDISGIALCVLTADCLPLFFWHQTADFIGIAHAGWRGLKAGIAFNTVKKMQDEFNCSYGQIKVCIGPGIRSCCYEVSREVSKYFPEAEKRHNKKIFIDLKAAALDQLMQAGIKSENIIDTEFCTNCNNQTFFSYRKNDKKERMISLIALTD